VETKPNPIAETPAQKIGRLFLMSVCTGGEKKQPQSAPYHDKFRFHSQP
jgi:hypothetical protein